MKELREDRRPADLWFWSDWFSSFDVRACSLAARGLWMDMLGIMSRAETKGALTINGKSLSSKDLAKVVNAQHDEVERLLIELEYYEVFSRLEDGTIINRRMHKASELSRKRAEAGRIGGAKGKQEVSKSISKTEASLESDNEDEDVIIGNKKKGITASFDEWWERYPRKVAKKVAAKAYAAAIKAGADSGDLLRAVGGYIRELNENKTEPKYIKHPSTFINEDRWRDYLNEPERPLRTGETPKRDHDDDYWAEVRKKRAEAERKEKEEK